MDPGVVNNQAQAKDPGEEKKDSERPVDVSTIKYKTSYYFKHV